MVELIIFSVVGFALIALHFAAAVWYKLRSGTNESIKELFKKL